MSKQLDELIKVKEKELERLYAIQNNVPLPKSGNSRGIATTSATAGKTNECKAFRNLIFGIRNTATKTNMGRGIATTAASSSQNKVNECKQLRSMLLIR